MNTQVPCPTCKKPSPWEDNPYRPFCSRRCYLIDLGHWVEESYTVPVVEPDEELPFPDPAPQEEDHDS